MHLRYCTASKRHGDNNLINENVMPDPAPGVHTAKSNEDEEEEEDFAFEASLFLNQECAPPTPLP